MIRSQRDQKTEDKPKRRLTSASQSRAQGRETDNRDRDKEEGGAWGSRTAVPIDWGLFWVKLELTRPLRKEQNAFRMAISAVSGAFGRVNGLITALGRLK